MLGVRRIPARTPATARRRRRATTGRGLPASAFRNRCADTRSRFRSSGSAPARALSVVALSGITCPPRLPPSAVITSTRAGILDAIAQRKGGEATEHDRMHSADARTGQHRDHDFGHQRHVDHDAVALVDAERAQRVCEAADLRVQLAIAQAPRVAGLAFENDRGLVPALLQVHVEHVVADIEIAIDKPAEVRRVVIVEGNRERPVPGKLFAGEIRPEPDVDPVPRGAAMRRGPSALRVPGPEIPGWAQTAVPRAGPIRCSSSPWRGLPSGSVAGGGVRRFGRRE